ncbi:MAG: dockerin type I domain-containing protein [Candidatus Zixiibacteriota bacterium]
MVFLINYLFKGGPTPIPLLAGDCNCDGNVDVGDVVYLINYLFKGGPPPSC